MLQRSPAPQQGATTTWSFLTKRYRCFKGAPPLSRGATSLISSWRAVSTLQGIPASQWVCGQKLSVVKQIAKHQGGSRLSAGGRRVLSSRLAATNVLQGIPAFQQGCDSSACGWTAASTCFKGSPPLSGCVTGDHLGEDGAKVASTEPRLSAGDGPCISARPTSRWRFKGSPLLSRVLIGGRGADEVAVRLPSKDPASQRGGAEHRTCHRQNQHCFKGSPLFSRDTTEVV